MIMTTDNFNKFLENGINFTPDWNKLANINDKVLPVCVQNYQTKEVLGIMYMNEEAFQNSCKTGLLTFYSTSRKKLWVKGEESGETFKVVRFYTNCEQNSLLCLVIPNRGGICHVKNYKDKPHDSCFYREVSNVPPYDLSLRKDCY